MNNPKGHQAKRRIRERDREHAGGAPEVVFDEGTPTLVQQPPDFGSDEAEQETPADQTMAGFIDALGRMIKWISAEGNGKPGGVMVRAYAFCWIIRPDLFGFPKQIEMAQRMGVSRSEFGRAVTGFRTEFSFVNSFMRSDAARAAYAARQRRVAAKRKKPPTQPST